MKNQRGMTLIEMIVASAILLLVSASVMDLYVHILREHARNTATIQLRQQARLVIQALSRDLARAETVLLPSDRAKPEKAAPSPVLFLSLRDDTGKSQKIAYYFQKGQIQRRTETTRKKAEAAQILSDSAASFLCTRKAGLLHVQVQCAGQATRQPLTSTLETDFYIGGGTK